MKVFGPRIENPGPFQLEIIDFEFGQQSFSLMRHEAILVYYGFTSSQDRWVYDHNSKNCITLEYRGTSGFMIKIPSRKWEYEMSVEASKRLQHLLAIVLKFETASVAEIINSDWEISAKNRRDSGLASVFS